MRRVRLIILFGIFHSARLHAQDRSALAIAQAETLFREGKTLMDRRRFDEACPKLNESFRLAPGGGTILTLALCYEGAGRIASAWATFFEASRLAARDGRDDRRKIAATHLAALEPALSRVEIRLPPGIDLSAIELSMDGQPISPEVAGVPTPVDPGPHTIHLQARGKRPAERRIEVGAQHDRVLVEFPPLDDLPHATTRVLRILRVLRALFARGVCGPPRVLPATPAKAAGPGPAIACQRGASVPRRRGDQPR